jgi:hypothetical protein
MTDRTGPDFDELIGAELEGDERERLLSSRPHSRPSRSRRPSCPSAPARAGGASRSRPCWRRLSR